MGLKTFKNNNTYIDVKPTVPAAPATNNKAPH